MVRSQHVKTVNYIVEQDGTNCSAREGNFGTIKYGGPDDLGGADGADAGDVIDACVDAL